MDEGKLIVGATVVMVVLGVGTLGFVMLDSGIFDSPPDSVAELDDEEDLPDGITKDGVQDAGAAANDHRESLSDSSYTLEFRAVREVEGGSGDPLEVEQTVRADGDGTILTRIERRGSSPYTMSIWTNESLAVRQVERNGETSYQRVDARGIREGATGSTTIAEVLSAGEFEPTDVTTEDGRQLVVLTATEPSGDAADTLGVESVSSLSGTVKVDREGRVHSLDVEFKFTDTRGNRITQTLSQDLVDVGSTSVDRPAWVPEAIRQTGDGRLGPAGHRATA